MLFIACPFGLRHFCSARLPPLCFNSVTFSCRVLHATFLIPGTLPEVPLLYLLCLPSFNRGRIAINRKWYNVVILPIACSDCCSTSFRSEHPSPPSLLVHSVCPTTTTITARLPPPPFPHYHSFHQHCGDTKERVGCSEQSYKEVAGRPKA